MAMSYVKSTTHPPSRIPDGISALTVTRMLSDDATCWDNVSAMSLIVEIACVGVAVEVLDDVSVGEGVEDAVGVGVDVLEAVSVAEAVYDDVALGVEATGLREIWAMPLQPLQDAVLAPPTVVDVDAVPPVPDSAMMVSAVASE